MIASHKRIARLQKIKTFFHRQKPGKIALIFKVEDGKLFIRKAHYQGVEPILWK